MSNLSIHLVVSDPVAASNWYTSVLGAREDRRITLDTGFVLTIDLRFGDTTVAIAGEFPDAGIVSPLTLGGTYGAVHLPVDNVDEVWARAIGAGAREFEPVQDAFWGERTGQFIDPFGHRWAIDQHLRDVPDAEVAHIASEVFRTADPS